MSIFRYQGRSNVTNLVKLFNGWGLDDKCISDEEYYSDLEVMLASSVCHCPDIDGSKVRHSTAHSSHYSLLYIVMIGVCYNRVCEYRIDFCCQYTGVVSALSWHR